MASIHLGPYSKDPALVTQDALFQGFTALPKDSIDIAFGNSSINNAKVVLLGDQNHQDPVTFNNFWLKVFLGFGEQGKSIHHIIEGTYSNDSSTNEMGTFSGWEQDPYKANYWKHRGEWTKAKEEFQKTALQLNSRASIAEDGKTKVLDSDDLSKAIDALHKKHIAKLTFYSMGALYCELRTTCLKRRIQQVVPTLGKNQIMMLQGGQMHFPVHLFAYLIDQKIAFVYLEFRLTQSLRLPIALAAWQHLLDRSQKESDDKSQSTELDPSIEVFTGLKKTAELPLINKPNAEKTALMEKKFIEEWQNRRIEIITIELGAGKEQTFGRAWFQVTAVIKVGEYVRFDPELELMQYVLPEMQTIYSENRSYKVVKIGTVPALPLE